MLLLIVIGCVVCGFGVLSVLSNERHSRLQHIELEKRKALEKESRDADKVPILHGHGYSSEVPIPVR